jgi:iron(II)-dependent oxidoreductase
VSLAAATYAIGADADDAYDNERPRHEVTLDTAQVARYPVTNAEFLAFLHDGGYRRRECWSDAGWYWRERHGIEAPGLWRRDDAGRVHEITHAGPRALSGDSPVTGLSWWEAEAFARWAGARLPHEYEWEALARTGALAGVGRVWEWCANPLHPYPGFRAFPYDGYSMPWFDGNHYVLRGGSEATHDTVRRVTFRNFHEPDKRHVFAGLRLAW